MEALEESTEQPISQTSLICRAKNPNYANSKLDLKNSDFYQKFHPPHYMYS